MTLPASFSATLVDEWWRSGVREAVIAPGSRSSPLAIALLAEERIRVHVRLDERSGAFFALGIGLASGRPAVMLTTSGTAAAEVHAAVVEADLAGVPLIICTADRPPELVGVGAPQTIEQHALYGVAVRYAIDLGVPSEATRPAWRSLASRLVLESLAGPKGPGPVHANLPFREPLGGPADELPPPAPGGAAWHQGLRGDVASPAALEAFAEALSDAGRGVFVVSGRGVEDAPDALLSLSSGLGWPILLGARGLPRSLEEPVVAHSDGILRSASARRALEPDLVVHLGSPHAGRVMEGWLADLTARGVRQVLCDPYGRMEEPGRAPTLVLRVAPSALVQSALATSLDGADDPEWLVAWRRADDAAEGAIASSLRIGGLSEPGVARRLVELAPPGATIFSSSSMPVRDLEWYAPRRSGAPRVLANRGANGIDGVTSTLLGVAAVSRAPVYGLVGDLAFLHDLSGLVWGSREEMPSATLVLIDNAGGGIFNFLAYPNELDEAAFERGFGTPQRVDVAAVARVFGATVLEVGDEAGLDAALQARPEPGLRVVVVRTDRRENVARHEALNAAIVAAVDAALG